MNAIEKDLVEFGRSLKRESTSINVFGPATARALVENWAGVKRIIERAEDPEYREYLRLKEKFEGDDK